MRATVVLAGKYLTQESHGATISKSRSDEGMVSTKWQTKK
jgi:hypothetical protein